MGFIISGQASGPGVAYNIIQTPTSSSGTSTVTAMARDSSGNMFVVGNMNTDFANNAGDMFLAKYDSSNTLQWQKSLTWTLASTAYRIEQVNDIYIDSSNNIFITGSIRGLQYSYYGGNAFFAKLDSSGSFLMQKEITQQPQGGVANQWYYGGMGRKIITDSSGNIYLALGGRVIAGTVMKLNSSGVIQWQKNQQDTNTTPYLCHTMNGLVLDESNGVLYGLSSPEEFNNAGGAVITVSKFNISTGASVWRTHFESSVNTYLPWGSGLVKGPSGDLYFAMACDHSNHNIYIGKLSASTGSVVWTKKFATSVSDYSTGIAVDSSENIYVSGYTIGSTTGAVLILKYDSSGSLLWQRNMYATPAASFDTAGKIYVESAGGFSVMLKINGKPMIAKLPTDGTMTGTYSINGVSVLYGASSGTSSTGTLTVTQPGDYYRSSSMTIDNTTINITTSSLTTAGPTAIGSGAGSPIASGMTMRGTGLGMVMSSYMASSTVELFAWGGGGGGGYTSGSGAGGAGGAASGTLSIPTLNSSFAVVVGGGGTSIGISGGAGPVVSGGGGQLTGGWGGQGGGYSGVFNTTTISQATALLIAGGGGGGSYEGPNGGAGGGSSGNAGGAGADLGGSGGTQSAGGAGGGSSEYGSALQGGRPTNANGGGGGGGGGGYWGGGSGSNSDPGSAGGGGSGYFSPTSIVNGVLTAGSGTTAGDNTNSLRNAYYGNSGASGNNAGTPGIVIVRYSGSTHSMATGGTITTSGGYVYHTFTSSGTFTYTGSAVALPTSIPVELFAWGGGGGGGGNSSFNSAGGAGGAAYGILTQPLFSTNYAVVVGGGGTAQQPGAGAGSTVVGGGGRAGNTGYGGQGGGYSGMFVTSISQATALLIAGGGGGGSYDQNEAGGAGGGSSGLAGTNGGAGGTQSAGGIGYASTNNGSALQGATPNGGDEGGGGGGGGGYWGGGAGNGGSGHPGGGGSGYYKTSLVSSATLTAGSGTTAGDSSNSLRNSYGNGSTTWNGSGTQGVFVIRYPGSTALATGGTITTNGGYVYHTFTSSGTFTYTG